MAEKQFQYHRIVSLTASLTETLYAIGAGDRVVGVTDTCDYPAQVRGIPDVGCWFEPHMDKLHALKPDLLLGLETAHSGLRSELEESGIRVVLTNPATVEAALTLIGQLGELLEVKQSARTCLEALRQRLTMLDAKVRPLVAESRPTVSRVLDIEDDHLIVAGPHSFQANVILRAGGRNVSDRIPSAYPKVSLNQFKLWNPEVVFFCGYDRQFIARFCANPKYRRLQAVQSDHVYQFDCGLTCRTGPRIVDMAELLFNTLYGDQRSRHPEASMKSMESTESTTMTSAPPRTVHDL